MTGDPALAAENGRRYDEWLALLETVLMPITEDRAETREEAALLVAYVDGLGLRIALHQETGEGLDGLRSDAVRTLERHLQRFRRRSR